MTSRPLLAYFSIACAVSWFAWLPRIASQQGWWEWTVPEWWHYAGAAGPITAALLVTFRTEGRAGVSELLSQFRVRPAAGWLLFALGSPILLFAIGAVVARGVTGAWPAFAEVAKTQNLPAFGLPLTLMVHVMTFGIGEETGWRGFALPRLQARHDALRATLLLSVGWGLWHVPSFFGNSGFANFGPVDFVGWFIGLVLGAVFLTWLYNSTRGSLMVIVLWHGLFNVLVASEAASGLIAAVMTTGIMLLAIVALITTGGRDLTGLSRAPRQRRVARPATHGARGGTAIVTPLILLLVVLPPSSGQLLQLSPPDVPAGLCNTHADHAHLAPRRIAQPTSCPSAEARHALEEAGIYDDRADVFRSA